MASPIGLRLASLVTVSIDQVGEPVQMWRVMTDKTLAWRMRSLRRKLRRMIERRRKRGRHGSVRRR